MLYGMTCFEKVALLYTYLFWTSSSFERVAALKNHLFSINSSSVEVSLLKSYCSEKDNCLKRSGWSEKVAIPKK